MKASPVSLWFLFILFFPSIPNAQPTHYKPPDSNTILKLRYEKLDWQGYEFSLCVEQSGANYILSVNSKDSRVSGLPYKSFIDNPVKTSILQDLDADGFPELVCFTQSVGSGSAGTVVSFSVLDCGAFVPIAFPLLSNPQITSGYMGHDHFQLKKDSLFHSFPIYRERDSNARPTGGKRQLKYTLQSKLNGKSWILHEIIQSKPEKNILKQVL